MARKSANARTNGKTPAKRGNAKVRGSKSAARTVRSDSSSRPPARTREKSTAVISPSEDAELIVRQGFLIDATGGAISAIPEVVLMANADGLDYLARVFAALAAAARKGEAAGEGVHLPRLTHPVNARLSDDLEFRFVPLNDENRRAMFKQHGVDMKSKQRGSLFDRYQETLAQFSRLQAQMRREDWMAAQANHRTET